MERATVMKTLHHGNLIPKPPNMRDRDASFTSYHHHHDANNIGSGRCRSYVDDSTNELSIFDAHNYFNNEVITNNDIHQKVTTIMSTSRVSPVATNMDSTTERSNIVAPEKGGDTTRYSSASSSVDGYAGGIRSYRARSFNGAATPTASSEASWNSQAALLTHHPNAAARASQDSTIPVAVASMREPQNSNGLNKKLKASSLSKPISILRRKCPCTGRKSVQVKEHNTTKHKPQVIPKPLQQQQQHDHETTKSMIMNPTDNIHIPTIVAPNNDWIVESSSSSFVATNNSSKSQRFHPHRVVAASSSVTVRVPLSDGFTFPVLNPSQSSMDPKLLLRADQNGVVSGGEEDQPPRDSLEVFQPPEPTSDSPRPRAGAGCGDDDVASDASSDLFEIESFSTASAATQPSHPAVFRREACNNAGGNGFFYGGGRRRSADEGSTVTECYAPSEVSVEWSVTTAEGYCYEESIAGDGGGDISAPAEKWRRKVGPSSSSGNGLLAGCRSEKAVSVGPQPVRKSEGQRGAIGTSSGCGGWRHEHVNNVIVSNGGGSRVAALGKPPLARPHSSSTNNTPRMSLAFAT